MKIRSPYLSFNTRKIMSFLSRKKGSTKDEDSSISAEKAEPHHLGKHTIGTMTQEVFSLKNTKSMFRDSKWLKRKVGLIKACEKEILDGNLNFRPAYNELNGDLSPLEV